MVAPGLFKLPRSTSPTQPRRGSIRMAPIANGNLAAKGQGRLEKTRNQSLKPQPLKGTTADPIKGSAQEHQQPDNEQSKAKTPQLIQKPQQSEKRHSKRITNNLAGRSDFVTVKGRNSAGEVVPIFVVTEPEGTNPARVDSKVLSQEELSKCLGDQSNDRLSREHDLEECSAPHMSDEVTSPIHQETHLLADCTPIGEIQKRQSIESRALSVCSPTIEPISVQSMAVQQHALADCTSSTSSLPKAQEISHAQNVANCQNTALEYYEEGEKKDQPQNISTRARVSTACNAQVAKGVQGHFLESSPTDGSASNARTTKENQENYLEFRPTGSSGSCDIAEREDAQDSAAARFAPNSVNGMDGIHEHLGENLLHISPKSSTPTSILSTSQELVRVNDFIINSSTAMIRSDVGQKSRAIKNANMNENLNATDCQRMDIGEIQRSTKAVHDLSPFTTRESWTWMISRGSDIEGVHSRLTQDIPDQKHSDCGQSKKKAGENATEFENGENSRAAG